MLFLYLSSKEVALKWNSSTFFNRVFLRKKWSANCEYSRMNKKQKNKWSERWMTLVIAYYALNSSDLLYWHIETPESRLNGTSAGINEVGHKNDWKSCDDETRARPFRKQVKELRRELLAIFQAYIWELNTLTYGNVMPFHKAPSYMCHIII